MSQHQGSKAIIYSTLTILLILFSETLSRPAHALLQPTSNPPLLDVPTYSLATLNEDGSTNMNILTYATPVSILPDRVWSIGLFRDTLSEENLRRTGVCVLQLLTDRHANAISLLGGTSGRDVDKKVECEKLGHVWEDLDEQFQVLPGCASYLKMTVKGGVVDAGSHYIVPFCEVTKMYSDNGDQDGNENQKHLSTGKLREWGIITEKGRVAEKQPAFSL
jgi:flavin reductase (DIM6/NTAB) family NADH-FMN oxidoreductase RutF